MDDELRARYSVPALEGFWRSALDTMESGRSAFSFRVEDRPTAEAVGLVLHKAVDFPARRQVSLVRLDEHLRRDGTSLLDVLAEVHRRAVGRPAGQMAWRSRWLAQVRRYDEVPAAEFDAVVAKADAVLAVVLSGRPWEWPAALDEPLVRKVVVRAVALDRDVPTDTDEADLWRSAGRAHEGG
ncbi:hypothetical protein ACFFQW_49455 [Umezawaea endophytica]|uniref:Uncharacterized protein n=1 Tax=Umezawaea endophytica TaxID=1654476 RepID=A0A9X3AJF0_9PSEU|nr:hypothetical protein [Umezawaea endophytica]MCS7484472.1 hypothetical protein [Umezawaea endophytica]